jgi:hypothetical protein
LTVPRLRSDIVRMCWTAFREQGIELVFPDMELTFNQTVATHLPGHRSLGGPGVDDSALGGIDPSDLDWSDSAQPDSVSRPV